MQMLGGLAQGRRAPRRLRRAGGHMACAAAHVGPTLQDIAFKAVLRLITLDHVFDVLVWAEQTHLAASAALEAACHSFIGRTFDALCSRHGAERVRAAIGGERFDALLEESRAAERARRILSHKGRVLERSPPPLPPGAAEAPPGDRAGGQPGQLVPRQGDLVPLLPYESVREGVAWPKGVDPARRERHLSDAEFEAVLGVPPADFYALPAWRQLQLKQRAGLF